MQQVVNVNGMNSHSVNGGTIDKEKDDKEDEGNEDEEWAPEVEGSNSTNDKSNNSKEYEWAKIYTHLPQLIILACGFAPNFTCPEFFFSLS